MENGRELCVASAVLGGTPLELTLGRVELSDKANRDVEKNYPLPQFIEKLRRLADALESGSRFEIQIAGERISVPVRATYNIEHERGAEEEEVEFQIKWSV